MTKEKFEEIYRNHFPSMYRLAKTILYDEEESLDVVSEIFVRLFRSDLHIHADKIEGFLMTSTRNRCRDVLRHKSVRERIEHLYSEEIKNNISIVISDDDRLERLMEFVKTGLPPLTRRIFQLRFISEMTYEEVAEETAVSKVTVYKHLAKSIKLIKEFFLRQSNQ